AVVGRAARARLHCAAEAVVHAAPARGFARGQRHAAARRARMPSARDDQPMGGRGARRQRDAGALPAAGAGRGSPLRAAVAPDGAESRRAHRAARSAALDGGVRRESRDAGSVQARIESLARRARPSAQRAMTVRTSRISSTALPTTKIVNRTRMILTVAWTSEWTTRTST